MGKWKLIGLSVLIVVGVLAGVGYWFISQPMYSVGDAKELALEPLKVTDKEWHVSDRTQLSYFHKGVGRKVLYVHGGPGIPPKDTIPGLDALAKDYHVYYYAQRGTGNSTALFTGSISDNTWDNTQALESSLGIAQQVADIERIRRLMGEEELIIVGHSYGALLASLYAAEFPDKVAKLVLIAPADLIVFPSQYGGLFEQVKENLAGAELAAYEEWEQQYFDFSGLFQRSNQELEQLDKQFLRYFELIAGKVPNSAAGSSSVWHSRAQYFSMGMTHDWRSELEVIKTPVLIVHGSDDIQPVGVAHLYADSMANAEVKTLAGAGHFMHYTHAHEFSKFLIEFLQ